MPGRRRSFSLFDRSKIAGDPYTPGIALFDEVEKAHRSVHRAMLHVMDNGLLKLANGQETISFRNSYVFMTSNLGSAELLARSRSRVRAIIDRAARGVGIAESSLYQRLSRADDGVVVRKALEGFFEPEFINRIDEIIVFNPLTDHDAVGVGAPGDLRPRAAVRGARNPAVGGSCGGGLRRRPRIRPDLRGAQHQTSGARPAGHPGRSHRTGAARGHRRNCCACSPRSATRP